MSITHGSCGDLQVPAVIATLGVAPCITDIALNYVELSDEGCSTLLSFLAHHPGTLSLELFGNQIGNASCRLVPALLKLQTLTRLKLGDNNISAEGASYIAQGLSNQRSLIQLHLGGNKIGDQGLVSIVEALRINSTLTSLGIRDNSVGPKGIQALVDLLCFDGCVLSEVQLKGNAIGDEGAEYLASAMYKNKTMRVLEVQSNGVGAQGAAILCRALHDNTTVHAVNFNDNVLYDIGAEAVAALLVNNMHITTVGLSGNGIDRRGTAAIAEALAHNTVLTGIDLGNNQLGNAGVMMLSDVLRNHNSTLMSLDIHLNSMNLQGVQALTSALLINTSLRHLDCGSNYSRNQGAHAWAEVIANSTVLTRLCLTDNEIGREGGKALLDAMRVNNTLRNFQFGGQSQVHPVANRIAPETRRAINNIVARNKHTWEETPATPPPQPTPVVPRQVVNRQGRRVVASKASWDENAWEETAVEEQAGCYPEAYTPRDTWVEPWAQPPSMSWWDDEVYGHHHLASHYGTRATRRRAQAYTQVYPKAQHIHGANHIPNTWHQRPQADWHEQTFVEDHWAGQCYPGARRPKGGWGKGSPHPPTQQWSREPLCGADAPVHNASAPASHQERQTTSHLDLDPQPQVHNHGGTASARQQGPLPSSGHTTPTSASSFESLANAPFGPASSPAPEPRAGAGAQSISSSPFSQHWSSATSVGSSEGSNSDHLDEARTPEHKDGRVKEASMFQSICVAVSMPPQMAVNGSQFTAAMMPLAVSPPKPREKYGTQSPVIDSHFQSPPNVAEPPVRMLNIDAAFGLETQSPESMDTDCPALHTVMAALASLNMDNKDGMYDGQACM